MATRTREAQGASRSGRRSNWSGVLESLSWTVVAMCIVLYGSGKHDLATILLHDSRVNRVFLHFGLVNVFFNVLLFSYVYLWLGYVRGIPDPARSDTLAVPAGAVTFVATILAFIVALWPVFGFVSIIQVVVVTYGLISALNFVPGVGPLRVARAKPAAEGQQAAGKED